MRKIKLTPFLSVRITSVLIVISVIGEAYAQNAPDSLLVTTWKSEHFWFDDSNAVYFNGYKNPDSTNLVDWTPMFSWRVKQDSAWRYQIQAVRDTTDTTTAIWNTGKVTFAGDDTFYADERTYRIKGDSTYMDEIRDGYRYWWRCRTYAGAETTASNWSAWNSFWGVTPHWPTYSSGIDSAIVDCKFRRNIRFGTSHSLLPSSYTVSMKFPTGYDIVLDSLCAVNYGIDGSQQVVYYDDFLYITYIGQDSTGSMINYVNRYDFSTRTWHGRVAVYYAGDVHNPLHLIIGADHKLHAVRGAHHGQFKYFRTDSAHVEGSGINIVMWDTMPDPSGADSCTYPRLAMTDNGNLYLFFRYSTGSGATYKSHYGYVKNIWNGSSYAGWGNKRFIATYKDKISGYGPSIYNGGCYVENDTLWLLLSWHDYYQAANKTRAISLVYSPYNSDSTGFPFWFKLGSADTIGKNTANWDTINNIYYGKCNYVWQAQNPDSAWSPNPFTNTPTLIVDSGQTLISFSLDDYPTAGYGDAAGGRWPVPTMFAKWNATDGIFDVMNLTGDTRFEAVDVGDNDTFSVEIKQGTTSGIKVICAASVDVKNTSFSTLDSAGATKYEITYPRGGSIKASATGYLDSVWVLVNDTVGTQVIRAAVYRRADSSFVDSTYHKTLAGTNTSYWTSLKFVNGAQIKDDTNYVVMFTKVSGNSVRIYRVPVSGEIYWQSGTIGAWPSKFTPSGTTSDRAVCSYLRSVAYAARDTFDNIDTPSELRDSVNTLSYMRIGFLGIELPDTFSQTFLDSGGTVMHSYLIAQGSKRHPRAFDYLSSGYQILQGGDLYVYSNVYPDTLTAGTKYYGAELYEWKCADIFSDGWEDRWSGRYLTMNTAGGSGRLAVWPLAIDGHSKQMIRSRNQFVDHINLEPYPATRFDGNDIRIVMARNNNGVISWYELDRIFEAVGMDSAIVNWAIPSNPATTVPADSQSAYARVFQVYYGNRDADTAKHNPDNIFLWYENFENAAGGTALNGYNSWIAAAGVEIRQYFDKSSPYISKDLIWSGKNFVWSTGAGKEARRYIGSNLTNVKLIVHLNATLSSNGRFRLKDDTDWFGIQIDGLHHGLYYGDTMDQDTSWYLGTAQYHEISFVVNSNGVSGYRYGKLMFSDCGWLTQFDSLFWRGNNYLNSLPMDEIRIVKWVSNEPEIWFSSLMSESVSRRRRMIMMGE